MDKPAVRVLLIEDNPGDVRLMQLALGEAKRASFLVESAGTLEAGVERLARQDIDIVLLDLSLPDSFGLQTFRTLQERWPQVPVVVLSGDDDESVATAAVNEGAQDFLDIRPSICENTYMHQERDWTTEFYLEENGASPVEEFLAGLDRQAQQRVVATADPAGAVRRGQERVDLFGGEVGDDRAVKALGRDGDHATD